MKNSKYSFGMILMLVALSFGFGVTSCKKNDNTPVNHKNASVEPIVVSGANNGGNVTCQEAADAGGLGAYEFTTGKQDYPFTNNSFNNEVLVTTDGTNVSWSITPPGGMCVANVAVIVKGGNKANVYFYNNGESSDSGLVSPANASGNSAGLSNLTICYNLTDCESASCDWNEETAYGGSIEGEGSAWWFAMDASQSGTYPIYAGQQIVSGATVSFDSTTDIITIDLGSNMQLQNVSEPVKVEGYDILPSYRPESGLFQLYKGSDVSVQGNGSKYYVVHLDVVVCN